MRRGCLIVGAGLAGAVAARRLVEHGFQPRVVEREHVVGGHVRTEWLDGVPYEPQGPHIFHTTDQEIWNFVSRVVEFLPYRHRVVTRIREHLLTWPLQVAELTRLEEWTLIEKELTDLPCEPRLTNFATYCKDLLGSTLFELCIYGYTVKQWDRDPADLACSVALGRIELRRDGFIDLFRDPYQGWPRYGYANLVERLLAECEVTLSTTVTIGNLRELCAPGEPVVVTSALDDFFDMSRGALEWRGVELVPVRIPTVTLAQPAMVIKEPSIHIPWTRTIETKWVRPDLHGSPGTVVMREMPGAAVKHYPVPDAAGENARRQAVYLADILRYRRNPLVPAGRLATYRYINMDDAIRDGQRAADYVAGIT